MSQKPIQIGEKVVFGYEHLQNLFDSLIKRNYIVIGPTVLDNAIVYEQLHSVSQLPVGLTDEQEAGTYRLKNRDDKALFGYNVGPHSWKKFLHPPVQKLWHAKRNEKGFEVVEENGYKKKYAFIGVRSCEIHAMSTQDRVFTGGQYTDNTYKSNRES
ncbi:MAG: sulfite reductase subunit A, partial [Candidatus Dadabacteria bacterium]|nr:sulfite reductase subunit A [Candidatus Dadabacteria bacterium]NIT13240.1 sulfite reductase subunit A [Candidatus Dadabacteria bacterium]